MKVIAIASAGGHWVELLRLLPALEGMEVSFISTIKSLSGTVPEHKFHLVPDSNRAKKFTIISSFFRVFRIIIMEKPNVIISTGAAPGLMGLIAGRILGIKTIWVDSIANVEKLSLSGNIAVKIAHKIYTQWPDLANKKVIYAGNILV